MKVMMGIMVLALTVGGGGGAEAKTASKECLDACNPICMSLHGAVESICDMACHLGCVQLLGKGRPAELQLRQQANAPAPAPTPS